jgi:predicted  nucleic acid-binding Zn-ribbon protein
MSKLPSAETQLRTVKSNLNDALKELKQTGIAVEHYRARSTKAEQEVAEWKRRFDALLKILPEKS